MHSFPGMDTVVEADGHIGHGAVLHGCHIGRNAMVGMNAVIMDGVEIGESSIVAALAFVKSSEKIPARSLVVGLPAKVSVHSRTRRWPGRRRERPCIRILRAAAWKTMRQAEPLREVEPDRRRVPLHRFGAALQTEAEMSYQTILFEVQTGCGAADTESSGETEQLQRSDA